MDVQPRGFATREAAIFDAMSRVVNFHDSFVIYRDYSDKRIPRRFLVVSEEEWRRGLKEDPRYALEYIANADASVDEVN